MLLVFFGIHQYLSYTYSLNYTTMSIKKPTSAFRLFFAALLLSAAIAACNNDKKEEKKDETPAATETAPATTDSASQAMDSIPADTKPVKTTD